MRSETQKWLTTADGEHNQWRAWAPASIITSIHQHSVLCLIIASTEWLGVAGDLQQELISGPGPAAARTRFQRKLLGNASRSASAARHRSAVFLNEEGQHVWTALWSTNFNCKYVKIHTFQWKRIRHQSVNEGNQWNTVKNDNGDKKVYKNNTFFANIW